MDTYTLENINELFLQYREYIANIILKTFDRDKCTARERLSKINSRLMELHLYINMELIPGIIKLYIDKLNLLKDDVKGIDNLRLVTTNEKSHIRSQRMKLDKMSRVFLLEKLKKFY